MPDISSKKKIIVYDLVLISFLCALFLSFFLAVSLGSVSISLLFDASNLKNSVYGLPELHREDIKNAQLVANPGCYPTSAILGILPFVEYIKDGSDIIVDAKSGVSGAGKKCSSSTHYVSINDNLFAYNPLGHRHGPEIFS